MHTVGEREGGMIWENSVEASTLPYVKQAAGGSSVYDAGNPKPELWTGVTCSGRWERGSRGRGP